MLTWQAQAPDFVAIRALQRIQTPRPHLGNRPARGAGVQHPVGRCQEQGLECLPIQVTEGSGQAVRRYISTQRNVRATTTFRSTLGRCIAKIRSTRRSIGPRDISRKRSRACSSARWRPSTRSTGLKLPDMFDTTHLKSAVFSHLAHMPCTRDANCGGRSSPLHRTRNALSPLPSSYGEFRNKILSNIRWVSYRGSFLA